MDNFYAEAKDAILETKREYVKSKIIQHIEAGKTIRCGNIREIFDFFLCWTGSDQEKTTNYGYTILIKLFELKEFKWLYADIVAKHLVDQMAGERGTQVQSLIIQICDAYGVQEFKRFAAFMFRHEDSTIRMIVCTFLPDLLTHSKNMREEDMHIVDALVQLLSDREEVVRDAAFAAMGKVRDIVQKPLKYYLEILNISEVMLNKLILAYDHDDEPPSSASVLGTLFPDKRSSLNFNMVGLCDRAGGSGKCSYLNLGTSSSFPNEDNLEFQFQSAFENVPKMEIGAAADVEKFLKQCENALTNNAEDWNKRLEWMKKVRSCIVAGAPNFPQFHTGLNRLIPAFIQSLKDNRSIMLRETCITISFMAVKLNVKFSHFVTAIFNDLMHLTQSATKIIVIAALTSIRFVIANCQSVKLIPLILYMHVTSKSTEVRKHCCEFIVMILEMWPTPVLQKRLDTICELLKRGLADPSSESRSICRRAFKLLAEDYPKAAENVYHTLDVNVRRCLDYTPENPSPSRQMSLGSPKTSGIPRNVVADNYRLRSAAGRSNSAIDVNAAKRAALHARRQMAATPTTPRSNAAHRSRIVQSQPSSRSASPSSRFSYQTSFSPLVSGGRNHRVTSYRKAMPMGERSRETSPSNRWKPKQRVVIVPTRKAAISQKILEKSWEAESALADALATEGSQVGNSSICPSKSSYGYDKSEDNSETSSLCSEQSFERALITWSGVQADEDVDNIIAGCDAASWTERKESLHLLHLYLSEGNALCDERLNRIMGILLKIFNDPHVKVFSLLLDALNQVIFVHGDRMEFCAYLLLTRIFNKMNGQVLQSSKKKMFKTLHVMETSIPSWTLVRNVFRFLSDNTQTPATFVKVEALKYLAQQIQSINMDEPDWSSSSPSKSGGGKDSVIVGMEKVVEWTILTKKQKPELYKAAEGVVLALDKSPYFSKKFVRLPPQCIETIQDIRKNNPSHYEGMGRAFPKCGNGGRNEDESDTSRRESPKEALNRHLSRLLASSNSSKSLESQVEPMAQSLVALKGIVQAAPPDLVLDNFRNIFKAVLVFLPDKGGEPVKENDCLRELALNVIEIMVKKDELAAPLKEYAELVIVKVVTAIQGDPVANFGKIVENCALAIGDNLPSDSITKVVVPLINAGDYPRNLIAIRMLDRSLAQSAKRLSRDHVHEVMQALLLAYDNDSSAVRKAAVFCIVTLYVQLGKNVIEPYFTCLMGAKLKLLHVYINRAQQSTSNNN